MWSPRWPPRWASETIRRAIAALRPSHLSLLVPLSAASCALVYPLDGLTGGDAGAGVDAADAGRIHEPLEGGGPPPDGGSGGKDATVDSGCGGQLLCPCADSQACNDGFCADKIALSPALYTAAGSTNFCTRTCCTSADCTGSTVCFASGGGGQYCVNPAWLGRGTTGSRIGGTMCAHDSDCRSGLCSGGTCGDTCCSLDYSVSQCAPGTQCVFGTFPGRNFDMHFAPRCAAQSGSGAYGDTCSSSSDCQGGLCFYDGTTSGCSQPCKTDDDCPVPPPANACYWDLVGNDVVAHCYLETGTVGFGGSCSMDVQCSSNWCETSTTCSSTCFNDSDCSAVTGWKCRPEDVTTNGMTYEVLACGQ